VGSFGELSLCYLFFVLIAIIFWVATFRTAVIRNRAEVKRNRSSRKYDILVSVGIVPEILRARSAISNIVATIGIMK